MLLIDKLCYGARDRFSHLRLKGDLDDPIFIDSALARSYNRRTKKSSTYDLHPKSVSAGL